jgi:methylated-DNA-protein-cysteine methyltransferase-like protein
MGDPRPGPRSDDRFRRICAAVGAIPRGRVSSYGEIAARAGLPRGARLVGRVLAECTDAVPWHRVVNAAGRISFPAGSAAHREQVRRLESEGVPVVGGRIERRYFRSPRGGLDEMLWGPGRTASGRRDRGRPR